MNLTLLSRLAAPSSTSGEPGVARVDTQFERITGSSSELEMLNVQHELSQRQQAVEVTTNAQRSLHDAALTIIQNLEGGGGIARGDAAVGPDALVLGSEPELKYVNLRRYLVDLNASIDKAIQFAVFEPNGEALWQNVRATVSDFLLNEWQSGALQGNRPQDAYFVKCDRTTMTQDDIDNGRLVILIGVATLRPSEFVVVRISAMTSTASTGYVETGPHDRARGRDWP